MEFKKYPRIARLENTRMAITQKIHGTNAQVCISENERGELTICAGSRNRWLDVADDNYGFAAFVAANEKDLIDKLGEGTHYGEWAGPGINSGEGLTEKTFILFEWYNFIDVALPPNTVVVPVLYDGPFSKEAIEETMDLLKEFGSKLVPGFMSPEGIVIDIHGKKLKAVFEPEETEWKKPRTNTGKNPKEIIDYSYLCQPIRLQKLLASNENYMRRFPQSLPEICQDYIQDLFNEGQIQGDEDQIRAIKKGASRIIFRFIRDVISSADWINGS